MEELISIIKYSVLFISNFYAFVKLSKRCLDFRNLIDLVFAVLFGILLYYTTRQFRLLVPIGLLLLTIIYTFIRYKNIFRLNTVTLSVIAYGITIGIMVFASVVALPLGAILYAVVDNLRIRNLIMIILLSVLQLVSIRILFKIKRFKSGLSLQNKDGIIELLLLISSFMIFLMTLFYTDSIGSSPTEIIILAIVFCGLTFIIWWRKHISNNYREQLYKRNESIYEERINTYEEEHLELIRQNEELSKIIHRDNKLIPAMVIAVEQLFSQTQYSDQVKPLLDQLKDIANEHNKVINEFEKANDTLPSTNNASLDAVVRFLFLKANKENIAFDFMTDNNAATLMMKAITNAIDLNTILCDLGENAIIATKGVKNGKILISFALNNNSFPYICFYDNGHLFDEKVIASMGKKRITTHSTDGGSGIGLMTLFEILQKYNASYCLDELPDEHGFTKKISITFDNLHKIGIRTNRENVKKILISRSDFFSLYM